MKLGIGPFSFREGMWIFTAHPRRRILGSGRSRAFGFSLERLFPTIGSNYNTSLKI